ncbi:hypothetical protein Tcan_15796 [Toxocara canis]|uniref:Uncharacterized protein n=1 Tax=Toxocara canis TaxID=6265 RepID=A0A0B2V810_TOXCA|nr:hypothetical protein Tcan_15796 [Toxocara canis]
MHARRVRAARFNNSNDPGAALLAFSRSFKKVRRVRTAKPRRRLSGCRQRATKRVRSLPNLNELRAAVPAVNEGCTSGRNMLCVVSDSARRRSNSLFTSALQLPSSALVLKEGGFFARNYLTVHLNNDLTTTPKLNGGIRFEPGQGLQIGFGIVDSLQQQKQAASNTVDKTVSTHKVNVRDVYKEKTHSNSKYILVTLSTTDA